MKIIQFKTCVLAVLKNNSQVPNFCFSCHDSNSGPQPFTGISAVSPWHPLFLKRCSISKYGAYVVPDGEQYWWICQAPDHLSALLPFIFLSSCISSTPITFISEIRFNDMCFIRSLFIWYMILLSQIVEGLLNIYPRKCLGHSSWPVTAIYFLRPSLWLTRTKLPRAASMIPALISFKI